MTLKQEYSVELTEVETECFIAINGSTDKLRKKCGEIYISEKDIFSFLCILCESPFEEIEKFFTHINNNHVNKLYSTEDKNETVNILNSYNKEIKSEENAQENYGTIDFDDNESCTDTLVIENRDKQKFEETKLLCSKEEETCLKIRETSQRKILKNIDEICISEENEDKTKNIFDSFNRKIKSEEYRQEEYENTDSKSTENCNNPVVAKNHDGKQIKEKKSLCSKKKKTFLTIKTSNKRENFLKCKFCNRRFPDSTKRVEHERIHTGERPWQCQICGKCFRTRAICMNHERSHTNIKLHKCKICDVAFKNKADLYTHTQRHGEKKIPCNYCNKLFHKTSEMKRHERTHTGEKPYKCNFCEKCFQTSSGLKAHIRGHSGIRPYKCSYCEKCFAIKAVLDNHIVMHTGARPFKCGICNATFPRKKALKSHEKIHSDVREYVCKICGEAFKLYQGLYSHMNKHGLSLAKS